MENQKQGILSPNFADGYNCTTQEEKSRNLANQTPKTGNNDTDTDSPEMGGVEMEVQKLQEELTKARLVRDKALSYIVVIKHEPQFFQHIGLTCYPEYAKKVEKRMKELADLYLRQQEINRLCNRQGKP